MNFVGRKQTKTRSDALLYGAMFLASVAFLATYAMVM